MLKWDTEEPSCSGEGSVHLGVPAREAARQESGGDRVHLRAGPVEVRGTDRRCHTLRVRHRRPVRWRGSVLLEIEHVHVVEPHELRARREIDQRELAHSVTELVQTDRYEVDRSGRSHAVEPVVPRRAGQARGIGVDVAVERRGHVRRRGIEVEGGLRVRQRLAVPRGGDGGSEVVPVRRRRPRLTQHGRGGGAGQGIERGIDLDLDIALEAPAPQERRVLERDHAGRAHGDARVAAALNVRRRVVEALSRSVVVVDGHRRHRVRAHGREERQPEEAPRPVTGKPSALMAAPLPLEAPRRAS